MRRAPGWTRPPRLQGLSDTRQRALPTSLNSKLRDAQATQASAVPAAGRAGCARTSAGASRASMNWPSVSPGSPSGRSTLIDCRHFLERPLPASLSNLLGVMSSPAAHGMPSVRTHVVPHLKRCVYAAAYMSQAGCWAARRARQGRALLRTVQADDGVVGVDGEAGIEHAAQVVADDRHRRRAAPGLALLPCPCSC